MGRKYYAVRECKGIGIFNTWAKSKEQVKGYFGADKLSKKELGIEA